MIKTIIFLLVVSTKIIKQRFLCYTSTFPIKQIHIQSHIFNRNTRKALGFSYLWERICSVKNTIAKIDSSTYMLNRLPLKKMTLRLKELSIDIMYKNDCKRIGCLKLFFCLLYKSRITMRTGCNERLLAFFTQVGNHFSKSFFNVYFLVIFSFVLSTHIVFI